MDNINDLKKNLDDVEQVFITKAVKDKKAIAEAKKAIVKQLDTLILKAETELLEKHLTTDMFTKPITEPAKAIAKPAIDVGKKIGDTAKKIGTKIGSGVSGWGKGIGTAAKAGASTWKDPMPKPKQQTHVDVAEKMIGHKIPTVAEAHPETAKKSKTSNISVKTKTPVPTETRIKQPPHFDNFSSTKTPKPIAKKPVTKPVDTGIPHDFGGTTAPTKISKPPESGTSKLMEQASKLERQLTQPKPVAKKTATKPVDKPAPKLTPFQEATKKINDTVAAKKAAPAPKQQQTKQVVPFKNIPETPKVNVPTGEIDTKLKTIKPPTEPSGITSGSGEDTAKLLKPKQQKGGLV